MKPTRFILALVIALSLTSEMVDAHGRFGQRCHANRHGCCSVNEGCCTLTTNNVGDIQTLYYCVDGWWTARACGDDDVALIKLAENEGKVPKPGPAPSGTKVYKLAFSSFAATAENSAGVYIVRPFGSLDGVECEEHYLRPRKK